MRFSLRTFLIVLTLWGCLLGLTRNRFQVHRSGVDLLIHDDLLLSWQTNRHSERLYWLYRTPDQFWMYEPVWGSWGSDRKYYQDEFWLQQNFWERESRNFPQP